MTGQYQDPNGYRNGDKVRIREGRHAGRRGVIASEADGMLEIRLVKGDVIRVEPGEVTNYSLAARRAWEAMPKKAGRPRLNPSSRKKMVSLRIDADVWERLGQAVELGLIPNRGQAVNTWLREQLNFLMREGESADHTQRARVADGGEGNGYEAR